MRIAISGPGRAGKDEAADFLVARHGYRYAGSTSIVISREVARREGITFEAAHAQRHARREDWYRVGNELRASDPAHLVREMLKGGDLVVGVRDGAELETARAEGLVDLVIWIDRNVPHDPTLKYGKELADIVIPNYWGLDAFYGRLDRVANLISRKPEPAKADFGQWIIAGVPVRSMNGDGASEPAAKTLYDAAPTCGDTLVGTATEPAGEPPRPPVAVATAELPRDSVTLYLSGPRTAYALGTFGRVAAVLRARGWRVISPADFRDRDLRRNINLVIDCDVIVQIPEWEQSNEATLENLVAEQFSKRVMSLTEVLDLG